MAALLALINGQLAELADGSSEGVEGPEVWDKLRSMWDMERLNGDVRLHSALTSTSCMSD